MAINQETEEFLSRFSRVHAAAIARNAKAVRRRLVQLIHSRFQLKRGPKPDPEIVQAYQMLQEGVEKRELIRRVKPGFDALDSHLQHLERKDFYPRLKRYELSQNPQETITKLGAIKSSGNSEDKNPSETRG